MNNDHYRPHNNNYGLSSGTSFGVNGEQPDPQRTIQRLRQLRQQFNNSARDYEQMAETVGAALTLLEAAEREKQAAQKVAAQLAAEQQAALLAGMMMAAGKKSEFVVLADGSGSMNGPYMAAALDAVDVVRKGAARANVAPAAFGLFGDRNPAWVDGDVTQQALRSKLLQTLNTGSELAPAVADMEKIAAVNTLAKKSTHFLIISDGDIFDAKPAQDRLELLLTSNKKVTIDFAIMARPGSQMEKMADSIIAKFPGRVRRQQLAPSPEAQLSESLQANVLSAMAERLREDAAPRKKRAAPQP